MTDYNPRRSTLFRPRTVRDRIVHRWSREKLTHTKCGRQVVLTVAHLRPITGPGLELASYQKPLLPPGGRWCRRCVR